LTDAEKAWFDKKCTALAQCSSLSAGDRDIVNAGANIVNWLRGQQQYADGSIMRAYARTDHNPPGLAAPIPIVLGDIASSKPAYLREPRKGYPASDYADYKVKWAQRDATVFVAANDGMLHAFQASTGNELWAYVPRITMKKLYLQASTTYGTNHQFTTDGSPEVADVQIGGKWRTVLVAGLNAGGRGYYALDVTDPAAPAALWELCADTAICKNSDPDLGLSFGNPQFGTWTDAAGVDHWVVFLTSGYNNVSGTDGVASGSGSGYLYVVDVATGQVLNKTATSESKDDAATPSGFARITAVTANPLTDPKVTYVYGGDNNGKMWRFDFTVKGSPTVLLIGDATTAQPVTSRPDVTLCRVNSSTSASVVIFGTGRLLDTSDISSKDVQSVYVLKDNGVGISAADWRKAKMPQQRLAKADTGNSDVYTISGPAIDLSTQYGWFFDLDQNAGERVNLDPKVVSGTLNVVTNIPTSSSDCSVGGTSNLYQLNVCTASQVVIDNDLGAMAGRTLSNNAATVGFIVVRLPNGTMKLVATTADGGTVSLNLPAADSLEARKAGWRRVRE
jgi:type IV pilus assembly protein PilY1